jgi:hypothetical protein
MRFAAGGVDHVEEAAPPALKQGLLGTSGRWHLPLGVTQAKPLLWGARVLLASSASMLVAWAVALCAQAVAGQGTWLEPLVALVLGLPCLRMFWQLWRGLDQSAMIPLLWGGLPPSRPGQHAQQALPGWSVPGWPHAVSVHVVFDLGPWVLVKMVSIGVSGHRPLAWFWVDARMVFQGLTGHHLRALLFSTRANDVGHARPRPADGSTVMASSWDIQRQWSTLLSSFKTSGQDVRGIAVADSDFARTLILDLPRQPSGGQGSPS